MRLYAIPYSTNVERVRLAAGHKELELETVLVDPGDRGEVVRLSGQELVPVLEDGETVVTDSMEIVRYLEELRPEPPLYPSERSRRAELLLFIDWFDRAWKRAPNEIAAELSRNAPDRARIDALAWTMGDALDLLEELLSGREYLMGDFSAADCAAFPFLKYGLLYEEGDDELFHRVLREHQRLGDEYPRLEAWIRRVDAHPRA